MERLYQIVEFTEEKGKNSVSVHVVPSKWINWDKKQCTCVCKFMPPPYNKKTNEALTKLIATNSDAPKTWSVYPVDMRGDANTYKDAQARVTSFLSSESAFAYSTDNDDHAQARSNQTKKYFKDKVHGRGTNVDDILYEEDEKSDKSITSDDSSSERDSNNDDQKKSKAKHPKETGKKGGSDSKKGDVSTSSSNKDSSLSENESIRYDGSSSGDENLKAAKKRQNNAGRTGPSNAASSAKSANGDDIIIAGGSHNTQNNFGILKKQIELPGSIAAGGEARYLKDTLLLHTAIKGLTLEVPLQNEQIRLLRNAIDRTLKIRVDEMTLEKFTEKHNVLFTLKKKKHFTAFNDRLLENKEMLSDFETSLKYFVEEDMVKTMIAVLKKILRRNLAMKMTAVRQSGNKIVFKDSPIYKSLFTLTCNECRCKGKPVTEKLFNVALGSIFNNAKDWDGQRNARRPPANIQEVGELVERVEEEN